MKPKSKNYKIIYIFIALLIIINIIEFFVINKVHYEIKAKNSSVSAVSDEFLLKEADGCPNKVAGNPEAMLKIKYFYNDLCPYCVEEGRILDKLIKKRGNLFYIEMFDTDKCREESVKEGVTRIPFFVFMTNGEKNSGGGFINEQDFEKFICDVTQGC